MSIDKNGKPARKHAGIHLNYLNLVMICIGIIIAVLLVFSTYRTTSRVEEIVDITNNYLNNQQTGGMVRDFTEQLGEQAKMFVTTPDVGTAKGYEAQLEVINAQIASYDPKEAISEAANSSMVSATSAFRARNAIETHAMRLAAGVLPEAAFQALPAFIQAEPLNEEELQMNPGQMKEAAIALLEAETYTEYAKTVRTNVNASHRLSSEVGMQQAKSTFGQVNGIVTGQKIMVFLFIAIAVAALFINHYLIISPIQKSVGNLDRREPIPVKGSYEVRHMAETYNALLEENETKTRELSYTATHDALTDTLNRAAFDKAYREAEGGQIALLIADVDHFKQYNDEFGHDIGDKVLQTTADALKHHFRTEDLICRIGGDEFCVIMPGICQSRAGNIRDRIERINAELAQTAAHLPPITLSAGVACWDRPNPKGSLFTDADHVLLELKKTRDTCCAIYQG